MRTRSLALVGLLAFAACTKVDSAPSSSKTDTAEQGGGTGARARGEEGSMGATATATTTPLAAASAVASPTDALKEKSADLPAAPPAEREADHDGIADGKGSGGFGDGHGRLGGAAGHMTVDGEFRKDQGGGAIKAGEWDDNANYREFQRYLGSVTDPIRKVDVRSRRFLVVRDSSDKAVPRCPVTVTDEQQHSVTLTTTASGRAILFPHAEGLEGKDFTVQATCAEDTAKTKFSLNDDGDGTVDLKLGKPRQLSALRPVDIAFVLDTTGSMSEEIASVKSTIQRVAESLRGQQVSVRIGLVEYKDRSDPFVTKVYPMSSDTNAFSNEVSGIVASGGGDMPEDMNAGLHAALNKLEWNSQAVTRAAFVIGDAPPHLDYQNEADYAADMKIAAHRGIQLYTIAASGMDSLGQAVWRQMAAYTGATNLFVLRGGAGAQSVGGGDPIASCGGTQTNYASGNLDQLIVAKIKRELKALDADPTRIPGLVTDENAKPCDQRIVFWQ